MEMSKEDFDLLVIEEMAACDRMLQWLEDDYNRPERIARRQRISEHIGRPIFRDDIPSAKTMTDDEIRKNIELFRKIGTPDFMTAAGIMEIHLAERS